ncbi:MAG TPA: hypothetical protein VM934_06745 [Pyrinomonadaceae bacterium]|nr:hypothetical protein [Pyrinomonadaceae bacterium]
MSKFLRSLPSRTSTLLLLSFLFCSLLPGTQALHAQSGRRGQPSVKPQAPPAESAPEGESESTPRSKPSKTAAAPIVSFVVFEDDNLVVGIDNISKEIVADGFMKRLGQTQSVGLKRAGRGGRKEARERAKNEKESHVVLLQLEEESSDRGIQSMSRPDPRTLVVRTYVYAPVSGDLKYTDRVSQRPYRQSGTIGGVRVPLPGGRSERYPAEYQLEQAARDAADHLMSRFNVILPPEN